MVNIDADDKYFSGHRLYIRLSQKLFFKYSLKTDLSFWISEKKLALYWCLMLGLTKQIKARPCCVHDEFASCWKTYSLIVHQSGSVMWQKGFFPSLDLSHSPTVVWFLGREARQWVNQIIYPYQISLAAVLSSDMCNRGTRPHHDGCEVTATPSARRRSQAWTFLSSDMFVDMFIRPPLPHHTQKR